MLQRITEEQRQLCEHCENRNKEPDKIAFCILVNNCPKLKNKSGGGDVKTYNKTKEIR